MNKKELIKIANEALGDFVNKYGGTITSADMQTFLLGFNICLEKIESDYSLTKKTTP